MPILFVSLGLGSVIASTLSAAPWLIGITRHRSAIFTTVGLLLVFNYWLAVARPRRMNCRPGEACHTDSRAMRLNRVLFWSSVAIYAGAVVVTTASLWWIGRQP